jgi:hypothetical protein
MFLRARAWWSRPFVCPSLLFLICTVAAHESLLALREPGRGTLLHAHNCYPESARWADRIDRALSTGTPVAVEQDLVWRPHTSAPGGQSVVAHEPESAAGAPTLEAHFFDRVAPMLDRALEEGRRDAWPLVVLHLDFKTNEAVHHRAIWDLLARYERWLTTAERVGVETRVTPFSLGPLLVLTESGPGQEDAFHRVVPVGARLRIFGTVPSAPMPPSMTRDEQLRALVDVSLEKLIPSAATNYRRWTNHSWAVIERGGPPQAHEWTDAERARLEQLVARAHRLGLWIRFYTLNGHSPNDSRGWSTSYNFGLLAAAKTRWQAAIAAGVDLVATDQYEEFAAVRASGSRPNP